MPLCPRCATNVASGSRFCPSCGAELSSVSQAPTEYASGRATPAPGTGLDSSASFSSAAFQPGHVLAGRYRIVGLLGRGGMGEVYRADDLKLGQPVSLKFLPAALAHDAALLARFHAEVRNARHVSHPNVCRVYDIGEADGHHFISMEYVDGEDLGTLLRRIGHLPKQKANEIARQICAGLAAAHDKGVLHRDLKPSNVMIDGEGRARITDFGLAVRTQEAAGDVAGTPAYMAPEQFEGTPATAQTDLYALGLVLFEIYTGRRAFKAQSFAEWKSRHTASEAPSVSTVGEPVDDAVERVIARCLEKDPARRPASALQIAAALPGGDPLAAALAAGETPSPRLVAAAGGEGALSPRAAWMLLVGIVVFIAGLVGLSHLSTDLSLGGLERSPQVLEQRAIDLASQFGYGEGVEDRASSLVRDYDQVVWRSRNMPSRDRRAAYEPWGPPFRYFYRQSPRWMIPGTNTIAVTGSDPPFTVSGMVAMSLDARGRLQHFAAVPPQVDSAGVRAELAPFDWAPFFKEAGLEGAALEEVNPIWLPTEPFDARREWLGPAPWDSTIALRITASSYAGRPTGFTVRAPWDRPTRMQPQPDGAASWVASTTLIILIGVLLAATIFFAQRNLRLGRGDRRGGIRLAIFLLLVYWARWLSGAHHVGDLQGEWNLFMEALSESVFIAVFFLLVYLAVEPFVRRYMPAQLIGWARVLDGRIGDPRVGRDVLWGTFLAACTALIAHFVNALPTWTGLANVTTMPAHPGLLAGGRFAISTVLQLIGQGVANGLALFGLMFLMRGAFRRTTPTFIAFVIVMTLTSLGGDNPLLEGIASLVVATMIATVLMRFGMLAGAVYFCVHVVLLLLPLPLTGQAPYAGVTVALLAAVAALTIFAFRTSIGSGPVFAFGDAELPEGEAAR